MGWEDLLFWKRNQTYGDGTASRSWDFTVKPGATIYVECTDGDVQVSRGEGSHVGVEIWLVGATADIDNYKTLAQQIDPATVRVTAKGSDEWQANGRGRARILLFVPERSNITIDARRGGAAVGDVKGTVAIRATGGDVALLGGEGPFLLRATDGQVLVERHHGEGIITSTGGSVQTRYVEGSLMINAIGGIELRSHSGPVRATSAEGSIAAELIAPDSACTLVSREGDIALKLLPNSAVDIDALSSSGSIMNMLRSDTSSTERPIYGHFMESLNGGGTPIVIRTERGTIQLSEYGE